MLTAIIRNIEYEEFEELRDAQFRDAECLIGTLGASYSPKTKIALFSMISDVYMCDELKEHKPVLSFFANVQTTGNAPQ